MSSSSSSPEPLLDRAHSRREAVLREAGLAAGVMLAALGGKPGGAWADR